ncbi:MAG: type II toxin-antitoxin system RelE/ParE family toxin [Candidatus Aminicenantes bacterium]|nr:type II toxin-antitoxin system RelE/ParE family toxin [Candidatus Aminicenantes bacterium]
MTAPRKNSISVRISDKALQFLKKLDKPDRIKIDKAIEKIRRDPLSGRPLTGVKELRKIRAGNYRVIYTFRKTELLILVVKIAQRQDVYKDLN